MRPIIYRLSLSEIYVPYAIPDPNWAWRSAFDVGEYNLGQYAEALEQERRRARERRLLRRGRPVDTGSAGGSYDRPHAVAMYERDAGSLWDRLDPTTLERDARFARELVVTAAYAIGNYTYGVEYVFQMDGAIDVNVHATGTTLNQGISSAPQGNQYGTVGHAEHRGAEPPALLRLPDRLRRRRDARTASSRRTRCRRHARRQRVESQETTLGTEGSRDANPATIRSWTIQSTTKDERASASRRRTSSVAPTRAFPTRARPTRRCSSAPFAQHPFWVTRYKDGASCMRAATTRTRARRATG